MRYFEGIDLERADEEGVLLLYPNLIEDEKARRATLSIDYNRQGNILNRDGLQDVSTQEGFTGGNEEAAESVSPELAAHLDPMVPADELERLEADGDRDHYVIRRYPLAGEEDNDLVEYAEFSDSFTLVNPKGTMYPLGDKSMTHQALKGEVPTIPTMDVVDAVDRGEAYATQKIGDTGNGFIVKSPRSSKGNHQHRAQDWDQVKDILDENNLEEMRNPYIIQPFIPHDRDRRWMTYGGEATSGMTRVVNGDYQTNVSGEKGTRMDALSAINRGLIGSLDPGADDTVLAEDSVEAVADYADCSPEDIITSVDLLVADIEDLEGLPSSYLDDVERYAGNEAYVVAEFEAYPGEMIDHLHMWEGPRSGTPALQEAAFLKQKAGEEVSPEEVAGDIDSRIWNRVRASIRSKEFMMSERIRQDMRKMRNSNSERKSRRKVNTGP